MIAIELIKTEKLSVAPVFPFQVMSACGEDCLTTIVRWRNIGLFVISSGDDGLETH